MTHFWKCRLSQFFQKIFKEKGKEVRGWTKGRVKNEQIINPLSYFGKQNLVFQFQLLGSLQTNFIVCRAGPRIGCQNVIGFCSTYPELREQSKAQVHILKYFKSNNNPLKNVTWIFSWLFDGILAENETKSDGNPIISLASAMEVPWLELVQNPRHASAWKTTKKPG